MKATYYFITIILTIQWRLVAINSYKIFIMKLLIFLVVIAEDRESPLLKIKIIIETSDILSIQAIN